MMPRDHHYFFAHSYFRHLVFDNSEFILMSLKSKKGKDHLLNIWYQVPKAIRLQSGKMNIMLPSGLNYEFHKSDKGLFLLIEMPEPQNHTEAYYICVFYPNDLETIRYFTLEFTAIDETYNPDAKAGVVCEWTKTSHLNYGVILNFPCIDEFINYVKIFSD